MWYEWAQKNTGRMKEKKNWMKSKCSKEQWLLPSIIFEYRAVFRLNLNDSILTGFTFFMFCHLLKCFISIRFDAEEWGYKSKNDSFNIFTMGKTNSSFIEKRTIDTSKFIDLHSSFNTFYHLVAKAITMKRFSDKI